MISLPRRQFLAAAAVGCAAASLPALTRAQAAIRQPVNLRELELVQARTGKPVRLLRDVMSDKVVALNFIFTECAATCPMQTHSLSSAQELLRDVLGPRVVFVSVSLDPTNDTPARLMSFAGKHHAGASWSFLTGELAPIRDLQARFDATSPQRNDHPPVIAIGRANAERWSRLYGFPTARVIAEEVRRWL